MTPILLLNSYFYYIWICYLKWVHLFFYSIRLKVQSQDIKSPDTVGIPSFVTISIKATLDTVGLFSVLFTDLRHKRTGLAGISFILFYNRIPYIASLYSRRIYSFRYGSECNFWFVTEPLLLSLRMFVISPITTVLISLS